MKVVVQNPIVSKNIDIFKKVVQKLALQKKIDHVIHSQGLEGFVNCVTGEIYFGERLEECEKRWKPICIYVGQEGDFLVIGIDESQFSLGDFFPAAYKTMIDTVRILNLTLQLIQKRFDADLLLNQLEQMEFATSKDVVHDAWHQVNRIGAERLLLTALPGTFLFRKDEYAAILEDELLFQHRLPIKCMTLSYLDNGQKVVDKTIVKRESLWLFYDDDPSLEGPAYSDIFALLDSLDDKLTLPLLNA